MRLFYWIVLLVLGFSVGSATAVDYDNAKGMSAADVRDCETEAEGFEGADFKALVEECLGFLKEEDISIRKEQMRKSAVADGAAVPAP